MSNNCDCTSGGGGSIKDAIKKTYARVAKGASCCGTDSGKDAISRELYEDSETQGLPAGALAASAGCANPVALAELNPGEVVLDLGSGGGIDVLLSAKRVGPTGKAYGLDMTDEMLELARRNQREAGVQNVEFLKGEIENVPLPDSSVDVIISNCVINLSLDKSQVFREAYRVLKPGGRFAVADLLLVKPIPDGLQEDFALWTGCISGALLRDDYKSKLAAAGFVDIDVETVRTYSEDDARCVVSSEVLDRLGNEAIGDLVGSFISAFVRASKPKA